MNNAVYLHDGELDEVRYLKELLPIVIHDTSLSNSLRHPAQILCKINEPFFHFIFILMKFYSKITSDQSHNLMHRETFKKKR